MIKKTLGGNSMPKIIFHIDVNSAFLSWTALHKLKENNKLDIRTVPAIIGGDQSRRHGIVLAKSVPAKKYGIVTAEPIAQAIRKCPNLIIEAPNHQLYDYYSKEMMKLLLTYTPDLEQISVDECFLDFTPIANHYPSAKAAALQIQNKIKEQLGFTVNIGIAPNKLLAKMASDFQKPDQIHTLFEDEIPLKMWPLPVGELYGVGKASASRLMALGIKTIGELAHAEIGFLTSHFKSHGKHIHESANGLDESPVDSNKREVKGVGNSTTLSSDVTSFDAAAPILLKLAESVGKRLRQKAQLANAIAVEIKYNTFETSSHQMTLTASTNTTDVIYQCACTLFKELWNQQPIRLLGIRTTKLEAADTPVQLSIFDLTTATDKEATSTPNHEKQKKLDIALDALRQKHGPNAVIRGSLLKK